VYISAQASLTNSQVSIIASKWLHSDTSAIVSLKPLNQNAVCVQFDSGWVIVCSEESAKPIIAYSYSGKYKLPSNEIARRLLNAIYENAPYEKSRGTNSSKAILSEYFLRTKKRGVEQLLNTEWGQEAPFNVYNPLDGEGRSTVNGCGPTALAQLMAYWKYPSKGYGSNSYSPSDPDLGILTIDYEKQTYNWENMSNDDISKIMHHAGVALEVDYRYDATPTNIALIPVAIVKYFNYSPKVKHLLKKNYGDTAWINIIRNELEYGRPVYYAGGAHGWIIDGYDDNNMFHMNFGWFGRGNGYYDMTSLINIRDNNLSDYNNMIVNIMPPNDTVRKKDVEVLIDHIYANSESSIHIESDDLVHFPVNFKNTGNKIDSTSLKYAIYINDELVESNHVEGVFTDYSKQVGIPRALMKYEPGTYEIKVVVDPENTIDELDETNNEFIKTFEVFESSSDPYLPDAVVDITHFVANGTVINSLEFSTVDNVSVIVALTNVGNEISMNTLDFNIYVDDEKIEYAYGSSCLKFHPGKTISQHIDLGGSYALGEHSVRILLDPDNNIEELDETNNEFFFSFSVTKEFALLPDPTIELTSFSVNKQDVNIVYAGDNIYAMLAFHNTGFATSSDDVEYSIKIDGGTTRMLSISSVLTSFKTYKVAYPLGDKLATGSHILYVELDPNNKIAEFNEENNLFEFKLTVEEPILTQEINLNKGLNLISLYVNPSSRNVDDVFKNINVIRIKSTESFWHKGQLEYFNSLKYIETGRGYVVDVEENGLLTVTGTLATDSQILKTGWNLVGVNSESAVPVGEYTSLYGSIIIKDFDNFWNSETNEGNLKELIPGNAYFIKIK